MKKMIYSLLLGLIFTSFSAKADGKTDTLTVKSSMVCEMCVETLTEALEFESGVKDLAFDLEKNLITIVYKPKKISPDEIKEVIASKGYWADMVPPSKEGFAKLHPCCRPDVPH